MHLQKSLIVFPGPLAPIEGMSQLRAVEQIKRLSQSFLVDAAFISDHPDSLAGHKAILQDYCNEIHLIPHRKLTQGRVIGIFCSILLRINYLLTGAPISYMNLNHGSIIKKLHGICEAYYFNMVIIHYWYLGKLFNKLSPSILKAIDTHYVVEENIENFEQGQYDHIKNRSLWKELSFSLKKQTQFFDFSDFLIFNSHKQQELIRKVFPHKEMIVTPNGQVLQHFFDYPVQIPEKFLLFYGALDNQFNLKGIDILFERIIPSIKKSIPDLKLMFVGSNPPDWLKKMNNDDDFLVTGFVQDIRPYLVKAYLMILPLFSAAGFRGRSVEAMAMGVPLIGSHNALDCIGLTHGENGYLTDDPGEMARLAIELFNNIEKRTSISVQAKLFVKEHYSIEATFGQLSNKIDTLLQ